MSAGDLGPWVLSLAALLQVWVIAAWKKLRHGRIEIFESGSIEVGYGNFGPSISLMGTLQANDKDVFVKGMAITLVRQRDQATHTFNWRTFRPRTLRLGDLSAQEFELAASFLVRTSDPHRYNVFFVDDATLAELKPQVDPVYTSWLKFKEERIAQLEAEHGPGVEAALNDPVALEALYREFADSGHQVDAFAALGRGCYWDAGRYALTLHVNTARPERTFSKRWEFDLTEADAHQLRLNSITVLRNMAELPSTYGFAYPQYDAFTAPLQRR